MCLKTFNCHFGCRNVGRWDLVHTSQVVNCRILKFATLFFTIQELYTFFLPLILAYLYFVKPKKTPPSKEKVGIHFYNILLSQISTNFQIFPNITIQIISCSTISFKFKYFFQHRLQFGYFYVALEMKIPSTNTHFR